MADTGENVSGNVRGFLDFDGLRAFWNVIKNNIRNLHGKVGPNLIFAGPESGKSNTPGFRSLVESDLPSTVPTSPILTDEIDKITDGITDDITGDITGDITNVETGVETDGNTV